MSYELNDDTTGGFEPQTYKTHCGDWKTRYNAYVADGMIAVQGKFNGVLTEMEDANTAIESAGIEGIDKISIAYTRTQTADVEDKRSNLCFFTSLVYSDAEKQIDDPFYESVYATKGNTDEHKSVLLTFSGTTIDLPYEYCSPENIFNIMTKVFDESAYDDFLYTDDEEANALIGQYMEYDYVTGTYGFEEAMDNWDSLTDKEQAVLAHCYEYSYRQYELVMDDDSYEAKEKREILERMANKFVNHPEIATTTSSLTIADQIKLGEFDTESYSSLLTQDITGTNGPINYNSSSLMDFTNPSVLSAAGKGMLGLLGEDSRGKDLLEQLDSRLFLPGNGEIKVRHDGAGTEFYIAASNEFDTPYMGLVGYNLPTGDTVVAYCTSQQRSEAYVYHQEEKNPGCYSHQKALGLNESAIATILTAAKSSVDMEVMENLSKCDGNYNNVFTQSAGSLSDSANDKILEYVVYLQSQYADKGYYIYESELNAVNSFYSDTENQYSQGYWGKYFDLVKENMTQEQKIELWISTDYVMTEEEIEEGRKIAEEELAKYKYRPGGVPVFTSQEAADWYPKYVSLSNKCSKSASVAIGVMTPVFSLTDFIFDGAEDLIGTAAEMGANSIDQLAGTNTLQSVLNAREGYAQMSDLYMSSIINEEKNAAIQNPGYYIGGKFAGNMLLYMATSPLFEGVGAAMGVKSGVGLFIANQAGQNAQDLLLDTRVLYNDLIADGNLSQSDKKALLENVETNAAWNMAFGAGGEAIKALKSTERTTNQLVDAYRAAENSADFLKGLSPDETRSLFKGLNADEVAQLLPRYSDDFVDSIIDSGKSLDITDVAKTTEVDELVTSYRTAENTADFLKNLNSKDLSLLTQGLEADEAIAVLSRYTEDVADSVVSTMPKELGEQVAEGLEKQRAGELASELYRNASEMEKTTTSVIESLQKDGVELKGLEHRLKTEESLERKLLTDSHMNEISLREAAGNINDSLRYTLVSDEANYTRMVSESLEELEKQGYKVERFKNFWGNDIYQGINVTLIAPNGTKIELQFHTNASYTTKEVMNHQLYEIARSESSTAAEIAMANRQMAENQKLVLRPDKAENLSLEMLHERQEIVSILADPTQKAGINSSTVTQYIKDLDSGTVYDIVKNSDSAWVVNNYDLITPQNAAEFVVCTGVDGGKITYNLDWPKYGGYDVDTIKGLGDMSGTVEVSRVGGDGGCAIGYGRNSDGTHFNSSQRSIPTSQSFANVGQMNIDEYKRVVNVVSGAGDDAYKAAELTKMGYDTYQADTFIQEYKAWFNRYEISGPDNIFDGVKLSGNTGIDTTYGFYGEAAPWKVGGVDMAGHAGQMNTIFSWGTLRDSGIITNVTKGVNIG
jgi:hypothetical protein